MAHEFTKIWQLSERDEGPVQCVEPLRGFLLESGPTTLQVDSANLLPKRLLLVRLCKSLGCSGGAGPVSRGGARPGLATEGPAVWKSRKHHLSPHVSCWHTRHVPPCLV